MNIKKINDLTGIFKKFKFLAKCKKFLKTKTIDKIKIFLEE